MEQMGVLVASRVQLPLKLAYALSIHKSQVSAAAARSRAAQLLTPPPSLLSYQGMTIDLLEVSMKGIFEYGQAYVALSRAVSLDRVRVRDFKPSCVRAHPRVVAYYQWLASQGGCATGGSFGGGLPVIAAPAPPPPPSATPAATAAAAGNPWLVA
jgi:ATP-dependent DNA helicase PIF1